LTTTLSTDVAQPAAATSLGDAAGDDGAELGTAGELAWLDFALSGVPAACPLAAGAADAQAAASIPEPSSTAVATPRRVPDDVLTSAPWCICLVCLRRGGRRGGSRVSGGEVWVSH
jgi:hypothetical protein